MPSSADGPLLLIAPGEHHRLTLRVSVRTARRTLAAALDALLEEGITDYSARTRSSRRRMAALYAGFVYAEELLPRLRRVGARALRPAVAITELVAVLRHLLFWATVDGADDPSAATRGALDGVRQALVRTTGTDAGEHRPLLLDCERCAMPGALLPTSPRSDALCEACAQRGRRLRAL